MAIATTRSLRVASKAASLFHRERRVVPGVAAQAGRLKRCRRLFEGPRGRAPLATAGVAATARATACMTVTPQRRRTVDLRCLRRREPLGAPCLCRG